MGQALLFCPLVIDLVPALGYNYPLSQLRIKYFSKRQAFSRRGAEIAEKSFKNSGLKQDLKLLI
jgi:hypothetical protein